MANDNREKVENITDEELMTDKECERKRKEEEEKRRREEEGSDIEGEDEM